MKNQNINQQSIIIYAAATAATDGGDHNYLIYILYVKV